MVSSSVVRRMDYRVSNIQTIEARCEAFVVWVKDDDDLNKSVGRRKGKA